MLDVLGELALELACLAALSAVTVGTEGAATPLTAARIGIGVAEVYTLVHKLTQLGVLAVVPVRDIARVQDTFEVISLGGRSARAAVEIFGEIAQPGGASLTPRDELGMVVSASTALAEAASGIADDLRSPKAWADFQRASDDFMKAFDRFLDKITEEPSPDDAPTIIPGLRLVDGYNLPTIDESKYDHMPRSPRAESGPTDDIREPRDREDRFHDRSPWYWRSELP